MATAGRTGYNEDVGDSSEEIFDSSSHGGPMRGVRIKAGTAALEINIPLLHKDAWVTIPAGESEDFYAPNRGLDSINAREETASAGATVTWFPILA